MVDSDNINIENARVYITADTGGNLAQGTVIFNNLTNANGEIYIQFNYQGNQPIIIKVRKSSPPFTIYKHKKNIGIIQSNGYNNTLSMEYD